MKKRTKRVVWGAVTLLVVGCVAWVFVLKSNGKAKNQVKTVKVTRGEIVDKALAVGTIGPENEISVKSKISGVVGKLYADAGSYVKAGDPLMEIRPDPTPLELAEAKRNVEMVQIELDNLARELKRQEQLKAKNLVSQQQFDELERRYQEAVLRVKIAKEKVALLESGHVRIAGTEIETTIRSPIHGYVLEKMVNPGDPVVPLTSYQAGTVLMTLADMSRLIFKGTVDEIDVGKLQEGMEAEIKIGALPKEPINGKVAKISLKGKKEENATVFPIEIDINSGNGSVLRAGYSANASIIIQKKSAVLMIPERVVEFRGDKAFVRVPGADGKPVEKEIQVGLSDAINIEVVSGLKEGEEVLEKPPKEIR